MSSSSSSSGIGSRSNISRISSVNKISRSITPVGQQVATALLRLIEAALETILVLLRHGWEEWVGKRFSLLTGQCTISVLIALIIFRLHPEKSRLICSNLCFEVACGCRANPVVPGSWLFSRLQTPQIFPLNGLIYLTWMVDETSIYAEQVYPDITLCLIEHSVDCSLVKQENASSRHCQRWPLNAPI